MPSFCVVLNCDKKYQGNSEESEVSFHKFPFNSSAEILQKWIKFTNRDNSWKPTKWSSICSRHFISSDFRQNVTRKCLKSNSIPTINVIKRVLEPQQLEPLSSKDELIDLNQTPETLNKNVIEFICRLCGNYFENEKLLIECFGKNLFMWNMINKCFPTLSIEDNILFPKHICTDCSKQVQQFSCFIDRVFAAQNQLELTFLNQTKIVDNLERLTVPKEHVKIIKIKQEPVVIIKEEILEPSRNFDRSFGSENYNSSKHKIRTLHTFCENCNSYFINDIELEAHMQNVHSNTQNEIIEIISNENQILIDIVESSEEFDDENYESNCKSDLMKIEESSDINLFDHTYSKLTETPPCKSENIEISTNEIIVESNSIECTICNSNFDTYLELSNHNLSMHTINSQTCKLCSLEFKSVYEYLMHNNTKHTKPKRYKAKKNLNLNKYKRIFCPDCNQSFLSKLSFNNHKRFVCPVKIGLNFNCNQCSETFNKFLSMRLHKKQQHSIKHIRSPVDKTIKREDGRIACNQCGRSYTKASHLKRHQLNHRPKLEWDHKCGDCGMLFDKIFDLRKHLRNGLCLKSSQNQNKNPDSKSKILFVCSDCGKALTSFQSLKIHEMSHKGIKPFVCEDCGKSFQTRKNLSQHKVSHSAVKCKCHLCDKVFQRPGGRNQHIKSFHLNIKSYECSVCGRFYSLKGDMQRCRHSLMKIKPK